ncbi:hypothetical protein KAR48_20355 [bacterium]|nr:hypothetical protein [bacterium]
MEKFTRSTQGTILFVIIVSTFGISVFAGFEPSGFVVESLPISFEEGYEPTGQRGGKGADYWMGISDSMKIIKKMYDFNLGDFNMNLRLNKLAPVDLCLH